MLGEHIACVWYIFQNHVRVACALYYFLKKVKKMCMILKNKPIWLTTPSVRFHALDSSMGEIPPLMFDQIY
jgi:hypothetical protein